MLTPRPIHVVPSALTIRFPAVESQPALAEGGALGPGTGEALPPPQAVASATSTTSLKGIRHDIMVRMWLA
jgi:hypothetical protein